METVVIIHGEKPKPSGSIHPAFLERLKKVIELSQKSPLDLIVVTGGKTRKGVESEAAIGCRYLKSRIQVPILKEDQSRTTIENINFTKKLLSSKIIFFKEIFVITSGKRIFRIKFLYRKLWPEEYGKMKFIPTKDFYPSFFYLYEALSLFLDMFDIKERFLLGATKRFFRNH